MNLYGTCRNCRVGIDRRAARTGVPVHSGKGRAAS
jgi:hypothetical protein